MPAAWRPFRLEFHSRTVLQLSGTAIFGPCRRWAVTIRGQYTGLPPIPALSGRGKVVVILGPGSKVKAFGRCIIPLEIGSSRDGSIWPSWRQDDEKYFYA